jgi:cyclic pyranopterin phosphate synthase
MIDYRIDGTKIDLHPERVAAWLRGEKIYPLYLEIAPSGGCNHRCTFCAVDYLGYQTRFLDVEIMKERLWELGKLGVKSIMWAGEGEPLLHRGLDQMLSAGWQAGIHQAITTNGIALTERFCEYALWFLAWMKVSINAGYEEDYRRIHQAHDGDWPKLWRNLATAVRVRALWGIRVTLGAQMVLLPDNVNGAGMLAYRCREMGLDYLVIKPYSQHPKSETRQYAGLEYAEYADMIAGLEGLSTDTFHVIARRETMARVTGEREYATCQATPWFWGYIMATGDVYGCSAYLGDPRFRYGNIREQDFASIWNSQAKRGCETFVRDELDIKECRKSCRMDHANRYLWRIKNPEAHDNFV